METRRTFPLGLGVEMTGLRPVVREAAVREEATLEVTVIIPARDEATNLPGCLESLLAQATETFVLGRDWEIVVVGDGSADGTAAVAAEIFAGRVGTALLAAPKVEAGLVGKANACWHGAQRARGRWLLFTDADTLHEAQSVLHAVYEAQKFDVALLSYSPAQVLRGLAQRSVMPLIFSELATVYPFAEVNDPASRTAAANGQFLMVERAAYHAVGGHRAVGKTVLEDVELAWNVKRFAVRAEGGGIRFRYAPEALRTRMYAGFGDMAAGWTKNLALLFPHALALAAWRVLDIGLLCLPGLLWLPYLVLWQKLAVMLLWVRTLLRFYRRVAWSGFGAAAIALAPLGLPLFVYLLVRSFVAHKVLHRVEWKGREYRVGR